MATITDLVIAASVDPQGVKRGLDQALGYSRAFANEAQTVIGQTFSSSASQRAFESRGAEMVEGIIAGMNTELDTRKNQLREQLARGLIDRKQFNAEGQKAAQAFNEALLASISHLEGRKLLSPGMRDQLVRALREDGIKAGEALAQGIQQGTSRNAGAITRGLGGGGGPGLSIGGRNAAPAIVASAFAFEGLARSAQAAESSVRAATRSVATFAAGFGPQGAVVAALIAGGIAMTEWWSNRNKEIEEARAKFKKEIDGMVNDANTSGLIQKLAQLERGDRSAGASTAAGPGNFIGGLNDLMAKQVADRERIGELLRKGRMKDMNELVDEVQKRQVIIDEMKRQQSELTAAILNPPPLPRAAGGMLPGMTSSAMTPEAETADRVARLTQAYQQFQALGISPTVDLFGRLIGLQHDIERQLASQSDKFSAASIKLRGYLVTINQLMPSGAGLENMPLPDLNTMAMNRPRQMAVGIGKPVPQDTLQSQVEYVELLERQARVMQAIGATGAAEVEQQANAARQRAIDMLRGMLDASQELSDKDGERARVQQMLIGLLEQLNVVQKKTTDHFQEIRDAIAGVIDMADGLGIINSDLRRVASGALALADALKRAAAARAAAAASGESLGLLGSLGGVGGAIGMAGAAIQIVGGIVSMFKGDTEERKRAEREVADALKENSKRLVDVRAALAGDTKGLHALSVAREALTFDPNRDYTTNTPGQRTADPTQLNLFTIKRTLKDAGMTFDQFLKIIEETGIKLFDDNGKLIDAAVKQALEYLDAVREVASRLSNSLEDQTLLKELHDRVFGKTSDADAIARELALLKQFAPDLADTFEGLDSTTKEGREAIQKALQELVKQIEAGTITPDMLGDFESIKDLIDIILGVQSSLDSMGEAVDGVTAALMNVPTGYKVALARFNATAVQQAIVPPPDLLPRRRWPGFAPNDAAASVSSASNITPTYVFEEGSILIDAREQSPEEIFDSFLKTAKRKAAVRFGNSTMWSQVQE